MLRYTCHALFLGSLVLLSGCDNSSSSSTSGSPGSPGNPGNPGTPGTPDPQDVVVRLPDVAVPGEAVQASARQAVIHLVDIAGITSSTPADYATKNLYLWNNETCDALSAPVADWNDVSTTPTGSDKYGPYWVIPLTKESGCINVIVRDGTNKLIDSDLRVSFSDFTDRRYRSSPATARSMTPAPTPSAPPLAWRWPMRTGSIRLLCCGRVGKINPLCASITATAVRWPPTVTANLAINMSS
ncbi:pullulanase [Klebsiella pneumoniae]|uniref:Pullulanase n=1 Tax=Klebsiella pneumoniae TaxID=573 RepID=A0A2X3EVB5_KLEPN|nr:pullulanase [Klebsiella pneumoniae]